MAVISAIKKISRWVLAGLTIVPGSRILYAMTHSRGGWKPVLP